MIGSFTLQGGAKFVMQDNGEWTGPDILTVRYLNAIHGGAEESAADDPAMQIRRAAKKYNATAIIEEKDTPEGSIEATDGWRFDELAAEQVAPADVEALTEDERRKLAGVLLWHGYP